MGSNVTGPPAPLTTPAAARAVNVAVELDAPIDVASKALGQSIETWGELAPMLHKFVALLRVEIEKAQEGSAFLGADGKPITREAWARTVAKDLLSIAERLSRAMVSLTKITDEAARLREFLTQGTDAPDLRNAGDAELIQILVDVAVARGLWRAIRARAIEVGVPVDAEIEA